MPNYGPPPVLFVRGQGTELWDREGRRYLDFLTGLAVVSLGHSHPAVAEATAAQAAKLHRSRTAGVRSRPVVARRFVSVPLVLRRPGSPASTR